MPQGNGVSHGLERGGQEMEFEPANWKPLEIQSASGALSSCGCGDRTTLSITSTSTRGGI